MQQKRTSNLSAPTMRQRQQLSCLLISGQHPLVRRRNWLMRAVIRTSPPQEKCLRTFPVTTEDIHRIARTIIQALPTDPDITETMLDNDNGLSRHQHNHVRLMPTPLMHLTKTPAKRMTRRTLIFYQAILAIVTHLYNSSYLSRGFICTCMFTTSC